MRICSILFAFPLPLHLFSKRERRLNDVFWRHYVLYGFWSLQRKYTCCWEFVVISWFNSDYWMKNILHTISFSTHMKKWLSYTTNMQLSQRDWIYLCENLVRWKQTWKLPVHLDFNIFPPNFDCIIELSVFLHFVNNSFFFQVFKMKGKIISTENVGKKLFVNISTALVSIYYLNKYFFLFSNRLFNMRMAEE